MGLPLALAVLAPAVGPVGPPGWWVLHVHPWWAVAVAGTRLGLPRVPGQLGAVAVWTALSETFG